LWKGEIPKAPYAFDKWRFERAEWDVVDEVEGMKVLCEGTVNEEEISVLKFGLKRGRLEGSLVAAAPLWT